MSFTNRVNQKLHDEHLATVALMERLEQLIARHKPGSPPDTADRGVMQLFSDLSAGLETEIEHHFTFEEDYLFSYLRAIGDEAIGAHLTDEHLAIRPLGKRMAGLARAASANGFDAAQWNEFRRVGAELCDRLFAHVQKEEMALLPLLEENMDADTEARLYREYVEIA
jgi:hemerythrin-like domain-containing protein